MKTHIFIQARMSSARYPGKVLAPFQNKPLIKHMIDRATRVNGKDKVIVLTSRDESDNPLVAYLQQLGCLFFRGSLNNVFGRFRECVKGYPCDYFVRLSADSPVLDPKLIEHMIDQARINNFKYDLVSNVVKRTFPRGQSVEVIKSASFLNVDEDVLTEQDREHVTPYFYRHSTQYSILSIEAEEDLSFKKMCVDTVEDLKALEQQGEDIFSFNVNGLCPINC